jgi:hypothetical protein
VVLLQRDLRRGLPALNSKKNGHSTAVVARTVDHYFPQQLMSKVCVSVAGTTSATTPAVMDCGHLLHDRQAGRENRTHVDVGTSTAARTSPRPLAVRAQLYIVTLMNCPLDQSVGAITHRPV